VISEHAEKLRDILARLDAAATVADMDLPGFRLHPLKGELTGFWAVTVRANWRVIFHFADRDASNVEPLGLTITDAAAALGVTRTTLSELVNGKRGISPEMAVRLSDFPSLYARSGKF